MDTMNCLFFEDIRKITKQPDGTYCIHFRSGHIVDATDQYPKVFKSIQEAKRFVWLNLDRVMFIHLFPRIWWMIQY